MIGRLGLALFGAGRAGAEIEAAAQLHSGIPAKGRAVRCCGGLKNQAMLSFRGTRKLHFVCVICSRICGALDAHTTAQKGQAGCHGLMQRALTAAQRLRGSVRLCRCRRAACGCGSGRGPLVCANTTAFRYYPAQKLRLSQSVGLCPSEDCFFPIQKKSCYSLPR